MGCRQGVTGGDETRKETYKQPQTPVHSYRGDSMTTHILSLNSTKCTTFRGQLVLNPGVHQGQISGGAPI